MQCNSIKNVKDVSIVGGRVKRDKSSSFVESPLIMPHIQTF